MERKKWDFNTYAHNYATMSLHQFPEHRIQERSFTATNCSNQSVQPLVINGHVCTGNIQMIFKIMLRSKVFRNIFDIHIRVYIVQYDYILYNSPNKNFFKLNVHTNSKFWFQNLSKNSVSSYYLKPCHTNDQTIFHLKIWRFQTKAKLFIES